MRGSSDASFQTGTFSDTVDWTPGGIEGEANQVTIFDGGDELWNGAWTFEGDTFSRSFGFDFGGGQTLTETSTLRLVR